MTTIDDILFFDVSQNSECNKQSTVNLINRVYVSMVILIVNSSVLCVNEKVLEHCKIFTMHNIIWNLKFLSFQKFLLQRLD